MVPWASVLSRNVTWIWNERNLCPESQIDNGTILGRPLKELYSKPLKNPPIMFGWQRLLVARDDGRNVHPLLGHDLLSPHRVSSLVLCVCLEKGLIDLDREEIRVSRFHGNLGLCAILTIVRTSKQ